MNIFKLTLVTGLALGLMACDMKKKLDKMSSNTQTMTTTTTNMGKATDSIKDASDNLKKTSQSISDQTQSLQDDLREYGSIDTQENQFQAMLRESDPGVQLNNALVYFAAFEFQRWSPKFYTQEDREMDYLKAVDLFFSKIVGLIKYDQPITNYLPDNDWIIVSAMAVAMSRIHPVQAAKAEKLGYTAVSFYDILKDGLSAKAQRDAGLPIKDYQRVVLENESVIRYLLQLRHNFFKAIVLSRFSSFQEGTLQRAGMAIFGWTASLDDTTHITDASLKEINELLWKCVETRDYMKSIGEPIYDNDAVSFEFMRGILYEKVEPKTLSLRGGPNHLLFSLENIRSQPSQSMFFSLLDDVLPSWSYPQVLPATVNCVWYGQCEWL